MELRIVALGQQEQQIQSRDFTSLAVTLRGEGDGGEFVEGEELLVVPREGVWVLEADGQESAGFKGCAREVQEVWCC